MEPTKFLLDEEALPEHWYNLVPDLPFALERFLDTPAHIYYKYEGVSPAGSHKPNTTIPQAYYNCEEGVRRLTTETGAGHG